METLRVVSHNDLNFFRLAELFGEYDELNPRCHILRIYDAISCIRIEVSLFAQRNESWDRLEGKWLWQGLDPGNDVRYPEEI